jgi:hypothetical protein
MRSDGQWGLKESIGAMGVIAEYFRYETDGEDFHEAAIFSVSTPGPDSDEVLKISFEKKTQDSKEFLTYVEFYQDGEWVWKVFPAFDERRDAYSGILFNMYIAVQCLSKTMYLITAQRDRLDPQHVELMEEACEVLKVDLETAISMVDVMPSLKNSYVPDMIESVYKEYKLKGTFGEDIFPN